MELTVLDKTRTQVGILSNDLPKTCPFWDDERNEKLENFDDTYIFSVPSEHEMAENIVTGHYILFQDETDKFRLFRIYEVQTMLDMTGRYKKAIAENAFIYDLNASIVPSRNLVNINADTALEHILQQTGWTIGEREYVGEIRSMDFRERLTAQAGLQQVCEEFSAEIDAYVEVYNGKIVSYKFDIMNERGENTGKFFEYMRDIEGLTKTTSDKTMFTALVPIGKDNLKINTVNDGLEYVYDDEANWTYNDGREYIKGIITNDTISNAQALKDWAKTELEKVNHPQNTYEVSVVLLSEMAGYEDHIVRLGDTVRVVDLEDDVTLSARIVEKTTSFSDPSKNAVVLGNFIELANITPSLIYELQEKFNEAQRQLEAQKSWTVELFSVNGTTFKNNQGSTQLIARVYDGKENITTQINRENFIWEKTDKDGNHDDDWEEAHQNLGSVITVDASEIIGSETISCYINDDSGTETNSFIVLENQSYLLMELPREFPAGYEQNLRAMQGAQIDWEGGYVYSVQVVDSKTDTIQITRVKLNGEFDSLMYCEGAGHGTMIGLHTSRDNNGNPYIWSSWFTPNDRKNAIAMFSFLPNGTMTYDQLSKVVTVKEYYRVGYDRINDYLVLTSGFSNMKAGFYKPSEVLAGKLNPILQVRIQELKNYAYGTNTLQSASGIYPYIYLNTGMDFTSADRNQVWCYNAEKGELVYHIKFNQTYYPKQGSMNEAEGAYPTIMPNGKRYLQFNLCQGEPGKRINNIYLMPEEGVEA
ncbi:hypothetical protein JRB95_001344 [Listeria monocytogenes]|nr:hypothetical protein [Listeria monocytogenes]